MNKVVAMFILVILFLLVAVASALSAETALELSAAQVVEKSWSLYRQAGTEMETVAVTIKEGAGAAQNKVFTRWIQYDPKREDKVVVKFSEPAMDNGLGLLIWRHQNGKDDQWLKLPSMTRARRVPNSDAGKYFGGTDLTYGDARLLVGEWPDQYGYRLLEKKDSGYVIEAKAKAGTDSNYAKRLLWINNQFAVTKVEYYRQGDQLTKTQTNGEIKIEANGLWRPGVIVFDNYSLKRTTSIKIMEREIGEPLAGEVFTQKFLEQKE